MVAVPHIQEAVEHLLEGLDYDLDGELYNEELKDDFNAITSIVKKTKPTTEDIQKAKELMKYYVYDIDCKGLSFAARYAALQLLFTSDTPSCLILAPTKQDKIVELLIGGATSKEIKLLLAEEGLKVYDSEIMSAKKKVPTPSTEA